MFPNDQICNSHHFEQSLRFMRKARKCPLPHEYIDSRRLLSHEIIDAEKDFSMAGFAFSTVKMTKLLYENFAVPPLKDGKARTTQ